MKLLQARKGQFVYYNNELHKIYSVKPIFKMSLHMYRIKDMKQVLAKAEDVTYYKPKAMDSFIFFGKRYTLRDDRPAEENGYILITKPTPEYLDHYSLNEFEKVDQVREDHIITTRRNSVRLNEFLVMVPGMDEGATDISYFDKALVTAQQLLEDENLASELADDPDYSPSIGDIYSNSERGIKAMVVAIDGKEIVFGHGERMRISELNNSDSWKLVFSSDTDEI